MPRGGSSSRSSFGDIVLRAQPDGSLLRVRDLGRVELGAQDYKTFSRFDKKPASETPWTKKLWIYDLRTNKHFTLKTNPLARADLDEFVACFKPENQAQRVPTWTEANSEGRWRAFSYEEVVARDKASLDIFWLKDKDLEDLDSLPEPDVLAEEIAEDLRTALEQFNALGEDLRDRG